MTIIRLLEIIFIISLGLVLARHFFHRIDKLLPSPWIELAAASLAGLQLILEGYRWQLLPAYALLALQLILGWRALRGRQTLHWPGWSRTILLILLVGFYLISILLPALLPIPRLSPPSGVYGVGTRTWHWVDENRTDPYAPLDDQPREIMVQAWYPIDKTGPCESSPWMAAAEVVAPAVAGWLDLPSFFLNHLVLVHTPSCKDAPIASSPSGYPVVLFSHGFGGFRAQNTNQMQHLASYGYVVVAVEHTYAAVVTVFPDGRVANHNPDTLPDDLSPADDLQAARDLGRQWAGDLSFVLDQLTAIQHSTEQNDWQGQLDLTRVGVFGHSTGGGAAIEFCFDDSRCSAALTLDPFMKPVSEQTLQDGLHNRSLHMFSEAWTSAENLDRFSPFAHYSDPEPIVVTVLGSAHYDFSDLPLLTPLAHQIGLKGPINGNRMVSIVNDYLLAYFNQSLKGEPSNFLIDPSTDYPEIMYQDLGDES